MPRHCASDTGASAASATTTANDESYEPHRHVLALEFPRPFSGYFYFIIYKKCLPDPSMLEEKGISPHFNLHDPRPHHEAYY